MNRKKEKDEVRFEQYYQDLLSIAEADFAGINPQTEVVGKDLLDLQNEMRMREAGKVKNRYLKRLAKFAGSIGGPSFWIALALFVSLNSNFFNSLNLDSLSYRSDLIRITNFFFLISGCTAGMRGKPIKKPIPGISYVAPVSEMSKIAIFRR